MAPPHIQEKLPQVPWPCVANNETLTPSPRLAPCKSMQHLGQGLPVFGWIPKGVLLSPSRLTMCLQTEIRAH